MPGIARLAAALSVALLTGAGPGDDGRWHAGAYSFSDELGGFRILGIAGTGTKSDPIVVSQALQSAGPVTLVIRVTRTIRPYGFTEDHANGFLHLRLETINASGLAWIEFEFELQEIRDVPSVYGDGLSFDQRRVESRYIASDAFTTHDRNFEPHDRLLFRDGKVDPEAVAGFRFLITDFTPQPEFYLVQDPRIPFS